MGVGLKSSDKQNINKTVEIANLLVKSTLIVFGIVVVLCLIVILLCYCRKMYRNIKELCCPGQVDDDIENRNSEIHFTVSTSTEPFINQSPPDYKKYKKYKKSETPPPLYEDLYPTSLQNNTQDQELIIIKN